MRCPYCGCKQIIAYKEHRELRCYECGRTFYYPAGDDEPLIQPPQVPEFKITNEWIPVVGPPLPEKVTVFTEKPKHVPPTVVGNVSAGIHPVVQHNYVPRTRLPALAKMQEGVIEGTWEPDPGPPTLTVTDANGNQAIYEASGVEVLSQREITITYTKVRNVMAEEVITMTIGQETDLKYGGDVDDIKPDVVA